MSYYYRCHTCKRILANKRIPYETALNAICSDKSLTPVEKENKKEAILNEIEVTNICCRVLMMTEFDKLKVIK